jgi:hypothetical protein
LICTGFNRGLLTICTTSTDFIPGSLSVVSVNCDPLGSPSTHYSQFIELFHICSAYMVYFRTPWLSLIIIYSRVSYCYFYVNLAGYVTFNTAYYSSDATVVLTVQWIANPHVPIHYNVYRAVCCLLEH